MQKTFIFSILVALLMLVSWQSHAQQITINIRYHSSPMMKEAEALREKYKLSGRQVRMFQPAGNRPAANPAGQPRRTPPTL